MTNFDFSELGKKIGSFFDKEMSQDDQNEFLKQISNDPSSQNAFIRERIIREKLKSSLHRPIVSPGLVDRIKNGIKR